MSWTGVTTSEVDGRDALALTGLLVGFIGFCAFFFEFTIDDAYITLRYAEHLARGQGITWNVGTDPVEGYTSTLWVLVAAIPHALSLPPVLFVKVAGVLAHLAVAVGVYVVGRRMGADRWLVVPVVALLTLNPAMAILAVQGMETTTAALFVFGAAVAALKLTDAYDRRWVVALYLSLLGGMLTRPDLITYAVGLLLALAAITYRRDGIERAARLTAWGAALLLVPGVLFIVLRTSYFGYPLPNSFYIKESNHPVSPIGILFVVDFLAVLVGPLLAATAALSTRIAPGRVRADLHRAAPLLVGTATFLPVWFFIEPFQGYLWRFQAPILPALLLALLVVLHDVPSPDLDALRPSTVGVDTGRALRTAVFVLLALFLVVQPLHLFDEAFVERTDRDQGDRVEMGRALAALEGEGYRLLVTESGAVPYYSGWHAIDVLGLNSERIAHEGKSAAYFREYDPDLVMFLVREPTRPFADRPAVERLVADGEYRLVAITRKSLRDDQYHAYFVDTESPGAREITCTARDIDGVEYVERDRFATFWGVQSADADCGT